MRKYKAFWLAFLCWILLILIVIVAKADGYMGDANAEFAAALEAREAAYTTIKECKVTFYCCERRPHICNAGPPYTTASGKTPKVGMCAADDVPLGATVRVDWEGDGAIDLWLVCEDRFGGHKKNAIDIVVPTHAEALEMGRRTATVSWARGER